MTRTHDMRWLVLALVVACSAPPPPQTKGVPASGVERLTGIVDSHVHLALDPVADQLAAHGVRAAVDLAAPERALSTKYPILVIQAGPMLTHPGGYPLDAWGSDGYGIGCGDAQCLMTTIDRLQHEGARVIKIALDDDGLDPSLALIAASYAHEQHLIVAVHALSDAGARLAALMPADVLAHTPVEPLSDETLDAWRRTVKMAKRNAADRMPAVITTLAAFGGSDAAIENLRGLRAAGVTALYGTDLGNLRVDGVSPDELALMKRAGMTDDEIEAAMTSVPWHYWGFDARGAAPAASQ